MSLVSRQPSGTSEEVPPSFICPLTLEVMEDPVTAADGHSYEAEAIQRWLETSRLSPLTGEALPNKQLTRSHALRNAIEEYQTAKTKREKAAAVARSRTPNATGVKVILLGDSNVGKSSLVHRVKEGTFSASASQPTIGCSFCTHSVTLPAGGKVNLAIWDTAGQEKYRAFTRQYFRGASAAVLVYDITSAASLEGARRWLGELAVEMPPSGGSVVLLVGSKVDRAAERQVDRAEAERLAASVDAAHIECSSKSGENVEQVFASVAARLVQAGLAQTEGLALREPSGTLNVAIRGETRKVSAGCCQ